MKLVKISRFLSPSEVVRFTEMFQYDEHQDILSTAIVQLYESKRIGEWKLHSTGVLYLIKQRLQRTLCMQLFSLPDAHLQWQFEIYHDFDYAISNPFFHMFEAEHCIVGLNFADDDEAHLFARAINEYAMRRKQPHSRRSRLMLWFNNLLRRSSRSHNQQHGSRKRYKLRKESTVIGMPTAFKHVTHVGFDKIFGDIEYKKMILQICEMLNVELSLTEVMEAEEAREYVTGFITQQLRSSHQRQWLRYVENGIRNSRRTAITSSSSDGSMRHTVPIPPPPQISWSLNDDWAELIQRQTRVSGSRQQQQQSPPKCAFQEEIRLGKRLRAIEETHRELISTHKPSSSIAKALATVIAQRGEYMVNFSDTDDDVSSSCRSTWD